MKVSNTPVMFINEFLYAAVNYNFVERGRP